MLPRTYYTPMASDHRSLKKTSGVHLWVDTGDSMASCEDNSVVLSCDEGGMLPSSSSTSARPTCASGVSGSNSNPGTPLAVEATAGTSLFSTPRSRTSPASGVYNTLDKQISAMKDEILVNESAYRQRTAMLEDDYKSRVELFRKKLLSLKEEAEWQKAHHKKELKALNGELQKKLDALIIKTEKTLQNEKEERLKASAEQETRLKTCEDHIAKLLDTVVTQNEQLEAARQDREQMQQEMKDVLVTLHFQSERFSQQSSKQEEALNSLRDHYDASVDGINNHLQELSTYVDSVQYEVGALHEQTTTTIHELVEEGNTARETMQETLLASWDSKLANVSNQIQEHVQKIETVAQETERVRTAQDMFKIIQAKTLGRFDSIESSMQGMEQGLLKQIGSSAMMLLDQFQHESRDHVDIWKSEKDGLEELIKSQGEEINFTKQEIANVSSHVVLVEKNLESLQQMTVQHVETTKANNTELAQQLQNHTTEICTTKKDIEEVSSQCTNVQSSVEKLQQETLNHFMIGQLDRCKLSEMIESSTKEVDTTNKEVFAVALLGDQMQKELEKLQQSSIDHLETMQADKKELTNKIELHAVEIDAAKEAIVALSSNSSNLQICIDTVRDCWTKELQETKEDTKQKDEIISNMIKDDMEKIRSVIICTEERLNSKLESLYSEVNEGAEKQSKTNAEINESMNGICVQIEDSNSCIKNLEKRLEASVAKQTSMEIDMKVACQNSENRNSEIDLRFINTENKIEGLASDVESRFEKQGATDHEFMVKFGEFTDHLSAFSSHINELEKNIQAVSDDTPKIVEKILQPVVQEQDGQTIKLQTHAQEISSLHSAMQSSDKQREALDGKMDTLNKTWETLFQHMVSQVKEDTQSLRKVKTHSEALVKEVRIAISAVEEKFDDFVSEQSSAQAELKSEVQLNMMRKNALQAKIESWSVEMDAAMENMLAMRDESRAIQTAVKKAQHQITKADAWKRTIEDEVRQTKVDQLEIRKVVDDLKGAQSVREHNMLDIDVDKFEKYACRVRHGRMKETSAKLENSLEGECPKMSKYPERE